MSLLSFPGIIRAGAGVSLAVILMSAAHAEIGPNTGSGVTATRPPQAEAHVPNTLVRYPDCPTPNYQMMQKTPALVKCRIRVGADTRPLYINVGNSTPCVPGGYWNNGPTVWSAGQYVFWQCEHEG